jgi:hypothetical protein
LPDVSRLLVTAFGLALAAQAPAPQNPSPMTETTRPHPRAGRYDPPGRRHALSTGTLFVRLGLAPAARLPLIVHFHGAPWLVEHHVATHRLRALLVTVQLGAGSGVYERPFAEPGRFPALLEEASREAAAIVGRTVTLDPIVLTSFSAGYGAIRAILRQREHYAIVSAVVLADSLHASYRTAPSEGEPRAQDLPVDSSGLDPFLRLAADAAAGRKRFWITHSEVFPGTYASTTETADGVLSHVGVRRAPALRAGPIGMQQLSESGRGRLLVLGFAGNSAPDHLDHLYALGEWLDRWKVVR